MAAIFGPDVASSAIVFITIVVGLLVVIPLLLRINKNQSYERWPIPLRLGFVGLKWSLVVSGGCALIYAWRGKMQDMATWF